MTKFSNLADIANLVQPPSSHGASWHTRRMVVLLSWLEGERSSRLTIKTTNTGRTRDYWLEDHSFSDVKKAFRDHPYIDQLIEVPGCSDAVVLSFRLR